MKGLRDVRNRRGYSQRELAARAGLSFRGYQLLERPEHNPRLESLERVAEALGLPRAGARRALEDFFHLHPESLRAATIRILSDGPGSWTLHLFDFVDAFRRAPAAELIEDPPHELGSARLNAIVAGTAEALCAEAGLPMSSWCLAGAPLEEPWFVAGIENLKATALAESPLAFRRRNVFVLGNFLARA
jgi:transcriptional regulator with XRE-family HTH domain